MRGMETIEDHISPDGFLRLVVTRDDSGDVSVGLLSLSNG